MRRVNLLDDDGVEPQDDPPPYDHARRRLAADLGGQRLGASLYVLAPGQAVSPLHYELAGDELLLVITGTPSLRTPDGERTLAAGDLVHFPRGPAGAHRIANAGPQTARVLLVDERTPSAVAVYPDSGKVGAFGPDLRATFRRSDAVDYYDGEPLDG